MKKVCQTTDPNNIEDVTGNRTYFFWPHCTTLTFGGNFNLAHFAI